MKTCEREWPIVVVVVVVVVVVDADGCSRVTQMTLGHQFLRETFGVTPSVGWQM